jgi:hypothetical protein
LFWLLDSYVWLYIEDFTKATCDPENISESGFFASNEEWALGEID